MNTNNRKNILSLSATEARAFLLKEESYFTLDLPPYFTFSALLAAISEKLNGSELSNFYKQTGNGKKPLKPCDFENVNYQLINNKNGKYAWRMFQLIHPALYVSLVHNITSDHHWPIIQDHFKKNSCVDCMSIPVVSQSKQSDKAEQVLHWIDEIEQRSIALALDYEYIFHTDITACYRSIYTHSITWALHTRETMKNRDNQKNPSYVGNQIDWHIQDMSYKQTNGIPEGSVLMDFIAEIVLSYADCLLTERIKFDDFKILRYRDDYRIFVNNPQHGEMIVKELTEILSGLGMQLSADKTLRSDNVILNSLKPDKLYAVCDGSISGGLYSELFRIKRMGEEFPNSRQLSKKLRTLRGKIKGSALKKNNPVVLISLLADIAFSNPVTYSTASEIISAMVGIIEDDQFVKGLILKIINKFKRIPNTGHMDVWLQRITLKRFSDIIYECRLCHHASGNSTESIWNSDWLADSLAKIISDSSIIDVEKIEKLNPVIQPEEVKLFVY